MKGVLIWCTLFVVVSPSHGAGTTITGNWAEAIKVLHEIVNNKTNCPYYPQLLQRVVVSSLEEKMKLKLGVYCNGVQRIAELEIPSRWASTQSDGCTYAAFLNRTVVKTYDPKTGQISVTTNVVDLEFMVLPPPHGNKTHSCEMTDPEAAANSADFLGTYVFQPIDGRLACVFVHPFTRDVQYVIYKPKICGLVDEYMNRCGITNKPSAMIVDDKKNLVMDLPACKGWRQVKWTITITHQWYNSGNCNYDFDAELSARHDNKDVKLLFEGKGIYKAKCKSIIHPGANVPISKLTYILFNYKSGGRTEQCPGYYYSFT